MRWHLSSASRYSFRWVEHWVIIQATLFLKWSGSRGVLCIVVWCCPQPQRIT
jgi:hypothetical protein